MRKTALLIGVLLFLVSSNSVRNACAQQADEPSKIEIGGQFSSLNIGPQVQPVFTIFERARPEAGIGGRVTLNLSRHIALEAEGNFFPHTDFGRLVQGQFGLKAGKRFHKFGIFAKARPGFLNFSELITQTGTQTGVVNNQTVVFPVFEARRKTFLSMDVGGVLELYPSRRILVRFDAGDTMVHVGEASVTLFGGTPPSAQIAHNFQFSTGIAVRILNPKTTQSSDSFRSHSSRKFEVGFQYSYQKLNVSSHTQLPQLGFQGSDTQPGFGGRLTYNFTPRIGVEVQTDFFPVDLETFANGRGGGRALQVQAGPKVGKRFDKFGLFGKARPGAVSFSKGIIYDFAPDPVHPRFHIERRTHFSLDLGAVLEFYPSPRIVARFDGGDTMIWYGATQVPFNSMLTPIEQISSETRHQFQLSAGVGFRF